MAIRKLTVLFFFIIFLCIPLIAQGAEDDVASHFSKSHQVGMRFGAWTNLGDLPPALLINQSNTATLETNIGKSNIYFEGFFGYRFNQHMMLELSLGISNRGSVTLTEFGTTNVGNVIIYPILLQLKLYPLSSTGSRLQPYFFGGGGVYYGRRSTQISSSGFLTNLDQESETDFQYSLGGGIDLPLGRSFGLDLHVKYMPIYFSNSFVAINEYDGVSITVGVKYLYSFKKGEGGRERIYR